MQDWRKDTDNARMRAGEPRQKRGVPSSEQGRAKFESEIKQCENNLKTMSAIYIYIYA